jgi:hypothetical protein
MNEIEEQVYDQVKGQNMIQYLIPSTLQFYSKLVCCVNCHVRKKIKDHIGQYVSDQVISQVRDKVYDQVNGNPW